ncbi:uncharacterized protein YqeH isoform X2 [Euwallacea fornicatus]|uniref:uncharacterized protein YqeH isoform X2 n=1 Tax=Euwallacea fornicatus TaxID=995702 RepID=UPI00338E6BD0
MLLLKRFQKNILNQNYYRICTSSLNNTKAKLDQKDGVEPSEAFIKEYEEKLLYNSVIDWSKPKSTYQQNLIAMKMRQNLERQIKAALQTVRPLPVSLKYFCEEKSTNSSNTIPQTLQEDFDKHTQSLDYTTKFPYININSKVEDDTKPIKPVNINTIKEELKAKKEILDKSPDNWMTYYENYEKDLKDIESKSIVDWQAEGSNINFGTADPRCPISSTSCGGCGAYLHCKDAAIPGYIPSEIFKNSFTSAGANLESIYCQRCHFLKEYNIALQVRVSADDYPKVLKSISFNSSLVLLLVDLIDFPCSIWPGLADILGPKSRIVVVGNKLDLLPKDDHHYLARIKQLLIDNLRLSGFGNSNIKHVELISAKTGYGIENLISSLHEIKIKGSFNMSGQTRLGINEKSPEFAFGKWCYDTPGVVHPDQILHLLTTEELVQTLPREIIRAETFCVKPGTSLFIAGLARLDYIQGSDSIRLTVFRANSLPITFCKLEKADSIYQELLGSDLFVVPIFKGDRKEKWPGLELAKSFKIFGKSRRESSYDVVLSNAGWVAVNCGLANYEFQAWTPQKRGVHIRDCLLPKAVTLRGRRIRKSIAYKKHRFI